MHVYVNNNPVNWVDAWGFDGKVTTLSKGNTTYSVCQIDEYGIKSSLNKSTW